MKLSLFCELNLPRPWGEDDERRLYQEALEQVELGDKLGFHCVWEVEHHFLEEYSHSSAPEVFLAAASQRTSRIRLGHGIVQLPPLVNHPARVAERIAALDLVSNGRVEFGTGEGSSDGELGAFRIDPGKKRAMWEEAVGVTVRAMTETPFTGIEGEFVTMPPRNVVPKPVQKPHPPMWVACSRRGTIHMAAEKGLGALTFAWVDPEEAALWVNDYYHRIETDCVPITKVVNPNVACVTMLHCTRDNQEAVNRAVEGANFFGYALAHFYIFGRHRPGFTNLWDDYKRMQGETGYSASAAAAADGDRLGAKMGDESGEEGLRGAIGKPEQIRDFLRRYEEAGVDEVIFLVQGGRSRHEDIMESLELFGREVMPEFIERDEKASIDKAKRLEPAVGAALARRVDEAPPADPEYEFGSMPSHWGSDRKADDFLEFLSEMARNADPDRAAAFGLDTGEAKA